ncbi:MAG: PASTA domain-containing protein [Solirubrobacteraceae bacterium]|nr:PASTA domain-containing protein [Solirubrobacteraceae bacterium]
MRRLLRTRTFRALVLLTTVAFAGVGGWYARGWATDAGYGKITRDFRVVYLDRPEAGRMPSVSGLTEADARQAVLDAGGDPAKITSASKPRAGTTGLVVTQDPAPGAVLKGHAVRLELSTTAQMPALKGDGLDDARKALAALGADVTTEYVYDAAATERTVTASEPPAGATMSGAVKLTVAEPPASIYLSALTPDGSPSNCEVEEDDDTDVHRVTCDAASDSKSTIIWSFPGAIANVEAQMSATGGALRCTLAADGKTLGSFSPGASAEPLRVALPGVTGLALTCNGDAGTVTLDKIRISGAASVIDQLEVGG